MVSPEYGSANPDATFNNLIRCGVVVDRQAGPYGPEVRVSFDDREMISDWLPIGKQGSASCGMHYVPRLGDIVTVLHYPTGVERGVVVCSHNTSVNPGFQPRSLNAIAMQGDNGEYFEFDPDVGCLSINGIATLYLKSNGDMEVHTGGNLTATVGGNATVTAANASVTAGSITLQGSVTIQGTLHVTSTSLFDSYASFPGGHGPPD
jgi:phage baseplate assembly protein V